MLRRFFNRLVEKYFLLTIFALTFTLCSAEILYLDVDAASVGEYEAGVKPGDWIEYELIWGRPPPSLYPVWTRREILDVNGTIITVNTTRQMVDGTINSEIGEGNILEGTGASAMIFIPANLGKGDSVHVSITGNPEDLVDVSITDEITGNYSGVQRRVIYAEFSSIGLEILIFWDKEKGVAVEIWSEGTGQLGTIKMTKTNLWNSGSSDDNPVDFTVLILIVTIIVSVAFIIQKRYVRSKRKKYRRKNPRVHGVLESK